MRNNHWHKTASIVFAIAGIVSVLVMLGYALAPRRLTARERLGYLNWVYEFLDQDESDPRLPAPSVVDANGTPMASWRQVRYFALRPVPQNGMQYDLDWQCEKYADIRKRKNGPTEFCFSGTSYTSVMAVVGPGTAFDRRDELLPRELPKDCILLFEVFQKQIHWMQPGDIDIRTLSSTIVDTIHPSSDLPDGFCVGFADRSVWRVRKDTPFDRLSILCDVDKARSHSRDDILGQYRIPPFNEDE